LLFRKNWGIVPKLLFCKEMNNDTQRTLRFLKSWAINTLAVLLAVKILPHHIHFSTTSPIAAPIMTALALGILNAFIRPILMLVALPLLIFTLGLFTLVINALLLCLVAWLIPEYFQVDTFGAAFIGAAVIGIVSVALNILTGGTKVSVQRRPPPPSPPPGKSGPGDGPVIDI
jgi:putative membrane protein